MEIANDHDLEKAKEALYYLTASLEILNKLPPPPGCDLLAQAALARKLVQDKIHGYEQKIT